MAVYNEIFVGRFNRALQKHFSLKGGPPAPQLTSEITPAVQFFWGNENRYLESWQMFGSNQTQGAVAAQNSGFRLRNPSTSNVVAVVIKILAWSATVEQPTLDLNAQASDLASTINTPRFDARGNPNAALIASRANNITAGTTIATASYLANTGYDFIQDTMQEIPLLPGDALTLRTNQVNVSFNGIFWWRERFLEDSERT